jgi:hypothetical protein
VGTEKLTEDQPLDVAAVDGDVVITGPDGIHGALTPDAARRSARRLENAASSASYSHGRDAAEDEHHA